MNKIPYKHFSHYVLRTPLLSIDFFKTLTSQEIVNDNQLKELFKSSIIREAIFLASPLLYGELNRWTKEADFDSKKVEKLKYSFLKYLSRMSSRCTPFGLFAGCSLGGIGERTEIRLNGASNNNRHTRLDMNYLVALSQDLVKNKKIQQQLLFYPNSSLYKIGNQWRYIEYQYVDSKRFHYIVGVDDSEYLSTILTKASHGILFEDLVDTLANNEISKEEAIGFIEELIESQILISEIEPFVSGPEFLKQVKKVLSKLDGTTALLNTLNKAEFGLQKLDKKIGNPPEDYTALSALLKQMETGFDLKFLFQTDMILKTEKNILDKAIINSVKKGLTLLNSITLPPKDRILDKFKTTFYERYEEREIPLPIALDVESGIGYKPNQRAGDVNPLIDDLIILGESKKHESSKISWDPINSILQEKLLKTLVRGDYSITLTDNDFKDFTPYWEDLPDTISALVEVVNSKGKLKIKLGDVGGSSAANLLGRFCQGDKELEKYTRKIIDTEKQMNKDKILAEIVHLPESRVGNILMRPTFRNYEIPYLAKSVLPKQNQLEINDLLISMKYGKNIQLRSKKLNREIIPRLTNAHNYFSNSLPIYHFLCDMQTNGQRDVIGLNLGPFANEYPFIPRIEYQNIILSSATWQIKKEEIISLVQSSKNNQKLKDMLRKFCTDRNIPQYVMLKDGDNELLINLKNLTSVRMLLDTVKKRPAFVLTEFLFEEEGIVKDYTNNSYANQIILSFYNSKKLNNDN